MYESSVTELSMHFQYDSFMYYDVNQNPIVSEISQAQIDNTCIIYDSSIESMNPFDSLFYQSCKIWYAMSHFIIDCKMS